MGDINSIDAYLVHTVSIRHNVISRGEKTSTLETGIRARIVERTEVIRESSGDVVGASDVAFRVTIVYVKPDQTVGYQDEIIIDSLIKPVRRIEHVRDDVGIRFKRIFI